MGKLPTRMPQPKPAPRLTGIACMHCGQYIGDTTDIRDVAIADALSREHELLCPVLNEVP